MALTIALKVLWLLVLLSGIRILITAKKGCDPERLKKVAGTKDLTTAKIGGWIATIIGALLLLGGFVSIG